MICGFAKDDLFMNFLLADGHDLQSKLAMNAIARNICL